VWVCVGVSGLGRGSRLVLFSVWTPLCGGATTVQAATVTTRPLVVTTRALAARVIMLLGQRYRQPLCTLLQLLHDRGCTLATEPPTAATSDSGPAAESLAVVEAVAAFESPPPLSAVDYWVAVAERQQYWQGTSPRHGRLRVQFYNADARTADSSVGVDEMDQLHAQVTSHQLQHLLLVSASALTPVARTELHDLPCHHEVLAYSELFHNPTRHRHASRGYRRLEGDELRATCDRVCGARATLTQSPDHRCDRTSVCYCVSRRLTTDPTMRYFGYQHNDMITARVDSVTAGSEEHVYVVVRPSAMR
jgi:hypothetical protein